MVHMLKTEEQIKICDHSITRGGVVLIRAYAGCGKSTTLRLLSETYTQSRFLYLCFNSSLAAEARQKFPRNVTPTTMHSLAYRHVKAWFPGKKLGEDLRPMEIKEVLDLASMSVAIHVRDTLRNYLCSPDELLSDAHLPSKVTARQETADIVLTQAKKLWRMMVDPESETPLSHDGYLKVFVLRDPRLENYDIIALDEGQDTNPITAAYVRHQQKHGVAIVVVGDDHQSIYGFRQARNFMREVKSIPDVAEYSLTTSFRLTQEVADIASDLLNAFKGDPVRITGHQAPGRNHSQAFIARTNATLLAHAHSLLLAGTISKIHFAGTAEKDGFNPERAYGFSDLYDVFHLREGKTPKSPYYQRFQSYDQLKAITESTEATDIELVGLVAFVEKWQNQVPDVLKRIIASAVGPAEAEITLTTAHRAKGLEWDSVAMADDFMDLCDAPALREELSPEEFAEEVNLIYVAVTRSMGKLMLADSVARWRQAFIDGRVPDMSEKARRRMRIPHSFHR